VRERQARNDARYDRPPPRWAALVPGLGILLVVVAEAAFPGREHHAESLLVADGLYVFLLLGWAGVAWRWHRRHLIPSASDPLRWRRIMELGPQTRARYLAPIGALFFGLDLDPSCAC